MIRCLLNFSKIPNWRIVSKGGGFLRMAHDSLHHLFDVNHELRMNEHATESCQ